MSTYTDASLVFYPSGYKASKAYSLKPTDGSGDLDFTRASTATRVNEQGLIEGVRTNLALYSNDLSNAVWNKTFTTITSNAAISPDGTNNANKIVETTDNNLHRAGQGAIAVTSGQVYTFSFYAKAGERNELELQRINTSGTVFNSISTTTADLTLGTLSVGSNVTSSSINSVGDGWYRISLSLTAIATGSGGLNIGMQKDGNVIYLGDGTSGVFIYGFQTEQSASATEYIPTTTTAVSVGMLANVPRIDYTGGGCAKLLLEPQRTNLQTQSNGFLSNWNNNDVTTSVGESTLISGETTTLITETAVNAVHRVVSVLTVSLTIGSVYTISFYAKSNGTRNIGLRTGFTGSSANIIFNPNTQTAVSVPAGFTTNITAANDGYYRYSITATAGAASDLISVVMFNGTSLVYTGTTESIYISAIQTELGSYPTSYIPTLGTAVTRVADAASKSGISSLIGQTEGTIYLEGDIQKHNESGFYVTISNGATINTAIYAYQPSNGNLQVLVRKSGNPDATLTITSANWTAGFNKLAIAYTSTTAEVFINGVSKGTTSFVSAPACSKFTIGSRPDAVGTLVGTGGYNQAILFPTRLTNTDLAALTTL